MDDDMGYVNLVDSEEIVSEFLDAGVKIENEKVVEELKKVSIEYNLTPADLYAQWLSYTTKNPGIETLDSVVVDELTARIHQNKIKAAQHSSIKAKYVPKINPRMSLDILTTYVSLGNVKKEPVDDDLKGSDRENSFKEQLTPPVKIKSEPIDEPIEQVQIAGTPDNVSKFAPRRIKIERIEDVTESAVDVYSAEEIKPDSDDHLFKKEVLCEFGRSIPAKSWISLKKERTLTFSPFDPMRHASTEEKFFDCNIKKSNLVMDSIFLQAFKEFTFSRVGDAGCFENIEPGELLYFGRIRMDIKDEFDEKLIFLFETSKTKNQFQLDLSRVKDFSLFPGQMVAVLGEVQTKNSIRVSEIVDTPYLIKPFPKLPNLSQPINIVTACGPYHLPNSDDFTPLTNLIDYCVKYRPEVLILFGPILEMTPAMFDFFSFSLFNDAIGMISEKLLDVDTRVIIVSSPKEWHTSPAFPTPAYNGYWPNIEFYPCPSVIDINGLIIGLSSVDVVRHITGSLLESRATSESGNRIKRILRHILVQNNLYPLYPPADDVTLEVPKLEYCLFDKTPHIIIIPSMLRNFIHSIEGCIFVNPEKVRKNAIGRIQVFPSKPTQTTNEKDENTKHGTIESSISAQIIKL